MIFSRGTIIYVMVSLIAAFVIVFYFSQQPGYTDSFYHYNAAVRLVEGDGFVDDYLWTYIGTSESLPAPSHLYWMPGTTMIAAMGMVIFGANYAAAKVGLALCLWGASLLAYWLGWRLGGSSRHAWQAGIIVLFGGFFMRFWGQTDTFAPYAFFGGMTLAFIGLGISSEKNNIRWWVFAGIFAAFSHLIRSDGLIMLLVGWSVLFFPLDIWAWFRKRAQHATPLRNRFLWFVIFTVAYLAAMSPWLIRNLNTIDTVLPVGGTQGAWYTSYNDLFSYPPDASAATLFADGSSLFVETRLWGLFSGQGAIINFIAIEGIIVLAPFILIALWMRRRDVFLRPIWVFALGIHLAFALVFPFPGVRGGLFHAAVALMPFWAILGLLGIDDSIDWVVKFRRKWNPSTAKPLFSSFVVLIIIFLSLQISLPARFTTRDPHFYRILAEVIPEDARVMINDPTQFYYYTGIGGVVVPNEAPQIALEIAERYDIDYLLLENGGIPEPMLFDTVPDFLTPIDIELGGATLYAIEHD